MILAISLDLVLIEPFVPLFFVEIEIWSQLFFVNLTSKF